MVKPWVTWRSMGDMALIAAKFQALSGRLDAATLRTWAATEARSLRGGGVSAVAKAIGMSRTTIHTALAELKATLLAINSADDERNPPDLGILDKEIKRVKNGSVLLIPGSDQTAGHGTLFQAKFWKKEVGDLLQSVPRRAQ